MKDRNIPCMYYTCAHETCQKQIKDVTLKTCKNCKKYKPRKVAKKPEPISKRRQKDKDRHDNWRSY